MGPTLHFFVPRPLRFVVGVLCCYSFGTHDSGHLCCGPFHLKEDNKHVEFPRWQELQDPVSLLSLHIIIWLSQ